MLDGEDLDAAKAALARAVTRLTRDAVKWPDGYGPDAFAQRVAGYTISAVIEARPSDRDADLDLAQYTWQKIDKLDDKFSD